MRPVNWCSLSLTYAYLCPHCFNGCYGRETGWRTSDRLADVLWIGMPTPFLGSSHPAQLYWQLHKRLLHTACHERVHIVCIKFLVQDVHQFESPRLSDMSNHLSCGSQHVDNSVELMEGSCLNHYNYLFANSCLISLGCKFSQNELNRAKIWK
jgi:hypothetical protein